MYYIANQPTAINVNLATLEGVGVTGLSQSNVNLKLIRSGITILNGVTGDYAFAEQHNGIYRIVLGTTLTTISDTDYVLIATDLTSQAIDDKLEFTLYAESVDSSYTKLKSEIDNNETILNTINDNTDTVESLLTNATYGLSAIKIKEDQIATQLSTTRTDILNEIVSQVNANEVKIDTLTSNLSDAAAIILNEINAIPTTPLLTNDSRLDSLLNLDSPISDVSTITQLSTARTDILNEVISQVNANETKIDTLTTNLANSTNTIINEINEIPTTPLLNNDVRLDKLANLDAAISSRSTTAQLANVENSVLSSINSIPTNPLLTIDSRLDNLANLDVAISSRSTITITDLVNIKNDIIVEVNENESKIDALIVQENNNSIAILGEVISQVNANEGKIDTIISNLTNAENNIIAEVNAIPTNPLLTNDVRLDSLLNLDATVSSRSDSTQLSTTRTDILSEVISRDRLTEINNLSSQLSNTENNITAEVNAIPTNPLTDSDPILVNIDTPISTRSSLTDQQVWSYTSRQLTGVSGVNQINVNDFMSQFIVNEDLYLTVDMVDTNTNPVTGLSYTGPASGSLDVILYKNGIKQTVSTLTVGVSGLEEGLYRVFLDKTLMDTPKVDYVLIAKDLTANAVTYKKQFSLFEVVGLEGAYQATIIVKDFNTNLLTPDVNVYIKNDDQSLLINRGTTNSSGVYTTGLGAGDYKVILKKAFNEYSVPEAMTVSSSGGSTFTFWGSGFDSLTPVTSGTCLVQGYVVDMALNPVKGAKITATETNSDRFSGINKIVKISKQATSNTNGYWSLELARASTLEPAGIKTKIEITYPGLTYSVNITVPDSSSAEFHSLI